jgi:hypothetical protein
MIHTYHPKRKRGEIVYLPKDAIVTYSPVAGEGSEVSLSVPAGRLMMKIRGEGRYTVKIKEVQKTYRFFSEATDLTVEFPEDGELIFTDDSIFCAWDIALFPGVPLPFEDAVSFTGNALLFDLKKVFSDMLYLIDIPTNINGKEIPGLGLPDSTHLTLPTSYRGVISLLYNAKAREITVDSEDGDTVDISEELTPLLPLLISYFIWIDENPEMASLYFDEYENLSKAIKQRAMPGAVGYTDVNRWS